MRSSVIAFFFSACTAAAALGQCVAPATTTDSSAAMTRPAAVARQAADLTARQSPELITAAGAVTHDAPAGMQVMQPSPPRARSAPAGERPRRAGPAMLLAALALMSGIALRRYSARDQ